MTLYKVHVKRYCYNADASKPYKSPPRGQFWHFRRCKNTSKTELKTV